MQVDTFMLITKCAKTESCKGLNMWSILGRFSYKEEKACQVKLFPLLSSVTSVFKSEKRLAASKKILAVYFFALGKINFFFLDITLKNYQTSFAETGSCIPLSSNKMLIPRSISCNKCWLPNRGINVTSQYCYWLMCNAFQIPIMQPFQVLFS